MLDIEVAAHGEAINYSKLISDLVLINSGDTDKQSQAAELDLAILSFCNHTITSYGSFSFWASFLAGKGMQLLFM